MKNTALMAQEWLRWAEVQSGSRISPGRDRMSEGLIVEGACESGTGEEGRTTQARGLFSDADLYPVSNEKPPRGSKKKGRQN